MFDPGRLRAGARASPNRDLHFVGSSSTRRPYHHRPPMIPVTVHAFISAPREDLFDFIADFGARPAWCDHLMEDYRLANPRAVGQGAGARYLLDAPGYKHYVESTLTSAERPVEIVEQLHGGRNGRSRGQLRWALSRGGRDLTRVEVTLEWTPGTPREAFKEKFGGRGWTRRQLKSAL